jgi:hypothetical protein
MFRRLIAALLTRRKDEAISSCHRYDPEEHLPPAGIDPSTLNDIYYGDEW